MKILVPTLVLICITLFGMAIAQQPSIQNQLSSASTSSQKRVQQPPQVTRKQTSPPPPYTFQLVFDKQHQQPRLRNGQQISLNNQAVTVRIFLAGQTNGDQDVETDDDGKFSITVSRVSDMTKGITVDVRTIDNILKQNINCTGQLTKDQYLEGVRTIAIQCFTIQGNSNGKTTYHGD